MTRHQEPEQRPRPGAAAAEHVTPRPDKERRRPRRLLFLALAAAALLPAARAAPAKDPVWIDPCGFRNYTSGTLKASDAREVLKKLKDYVNGAITTATREWKRASSLYQNLREGDFPIDMEWLPRNQFEHYDDTVRGMKLREKVAHLLQLVHDGVQKYLATVVWLQADAGAREVLPLPDQKARADFLGKIRSKLKSVQCEAQHAVVQSHAELAVARPLLREVVDEAAFPQPSQSRAQLLLRDGAYRQRLDAFLRDCRRALAAEMAQLKGRRGGQKHGKAAAAAPRGQRHQRRRDRQRRRQQQQQA